MAFLPFSVARGATGRLTAPVLGAALLALAACQQDGPTSPAAVAPATAPSRSVATAAVGDSIPDEYVVVFADGVQNVPGTAAQLVGAQGGSLRFTYETVLRGFAAHLSPAAAEALRHNPNVARVSPDRVVRATTIQSNAPWGLDRIDQAALPLNGSYAYADSGAGVNVYIVDTGILTSHQEFGGRAAGAYTAISDGNGTTDCNGHGTHVAGTVGGRTTGVAKGAKLWAVRVLDCTGSGTSSGVIAGINWVAQNGARPAVINMSLGGSADATLNQAVTNAVNAGVVVVVAAGNETADACNTSPASAPAAITVAASDNNDVQASFSNYGSCVDLYAPGTSIYSSYYTATNAYATMSGTSMATPHVAGAAALVLQTNPQATPAQVAQQITSKAVSGRIASASAGTPNLLLQSTGLETVLGGTTTTPVTTSPTPTVDAPPTASFTASCPGTRSTCNFDASASTDDKGIASYAWVFSDGGSASGVTASHTFAAKGTYTATLTVTDTNGQKSSTSRTLTVKKV